jgi:hypothetical protein
MLACSYMQYISLAYYTHSNKQKKGNEMATILSLKRQILALSWSSVVAGLQGKINVSRSKG